MLQKYVHQSAANQLQLTWHDVSEPDCGHRDEAEVESVKKWNVLIQTDKVGTETDTHQSTIKCIPIVCGSYDGWYSHYAIKWVSWFLNIPIQ